jgi:hypothetical protein
MRRFKIGCPQADVDNRDGTGQGPPGRHHQRGLQHAEAHRHVRGHGQPGDGPGVGVDPTGDVHRHDWDTGCEHGTNDARRRLANRSGAADAQDPVEDQVRTGEHPRDRWVVPVDDASACRPRCRRALRVHAPRVTDCHRGHSSLGQGRQGPEGITSVVPGADESHHVRPTHSAAAAAQEVHAHAGEGCRGPLHEHRLGHPGPRLSPTDHLNRTDRAHLHLPGSCLPHGPDTRRRTTRTIHTTRHIGNVRHGPTRDRVGGRRIPPPPILPQPGRERGTQVPLGIPRVTSP